MDPNRLGKLGENLFSTLIMEPWDREDAFFDPTFLEAKFPTLDFYVELVGAPGRYFFFAQVKTTANGYEGRGKSKRLKVQVSREDLDRLEEFPAPTYIFGIDQQTWAAYLLSANEYVPRLADFPTTFPLNKENMQRLWDEVSAYWTGKDMVLRDSYFRE
jgi:hypothetical protein